MNTRTNSETRESEFDWIPEYCLCGSPDQRCAYCGRPVIFAPACIGLDACTGDHPAETNASQQLLRVHVQFSRPVRFAKRATLRAAQMPANTVSMPRRALPRIRNNRRAHND